KRFIIREGPGLEQQGRPPVRAAQPFLEGGLQEAPMPAQRLAWDPPLAGGFFHRIPRQAQVTRGFFKRQHFSNGYTPVHVIAPVGSETRATRAPVSGRCPPADAPAATRRPPGPPAG